ncbi:Site-specific DNA recombinase [Malonomonas rubra DSM 5091]|uniref:Site-specific DNA recombinase n=1 Tax=Malonomonas rubra DSM 5091 TaxID=1122189 RepID=A0A1M6E0B8_MALRU|nr:recombinase family protein [Malonomonas rubra]SHI78835.1 Site-specific DNA recombinase [Malonomonas rubra DSM 5091]
MEGQKIGYARVSTIGQSLDIQKKKLEKYGCYKVFSEQKSGAKTSNRQELNRALEYVREGDVFIVTKLDRLARSVADLSAISKTLEEKKVDFVVMDQAIDTTTPAGKLTFHVLAAIGEFEREMIATRTAEGRAAALAKGVKFGRKKKIDALSDKKRRQMIKEFDTGALSKEDLAEKYRMSRASLYRAVKIAREELTGLSRPST